MSLIGIEEHWTLDSVDRALRTAPGPVDESLVLNKHGDTASRLADLGAGRRGFEHPILGGPSWTILKHPTGAENPDPPCSHEAGMPACAGRVAVLRYGGLDSRYREAL